MQFTKLFNSILDSTIWQEPPATKICWITMLAMCDRAGDVFASVPGLANRAGVTIEEAEAAIACFLSPDKYSRTKDHEGRRIAEIDGGWTLLNHGKYRALLSAEERKEYNRRKQADFRAKRQAASNPVNDMSNDVKLRNQMSAMSAHTEAEAEAEKKERTKINGVSIPEGASKPLCTLTQAKSSAQMAGMTEQEAECWWHARNANGWVKSTASGHPIKIASFQSDMKQSLGWVREQIAKHGVNGKKAWKPNL